MHRNAILLLAAVLLGSVTAACGDDDGAADQPDRYRDVGALAARLDGIAEGCTLEYEGLVDDQREVSVCTLDGEVAELSVWTDLSALEALVDDAKSSGDPLVSGPNWTVDVVDPDLASRVADATGGVDHG